MITVLHTKEDMAWLRETHLPKLDPKYLSAVIHGKEDFPDRIDCYESADPSMQDSPLVYWWIADRYVECGKR